MSGRKVLIVDKEKLVLDFYRMMLKKTKEGCEVFTALTEQEAWDIFQKEKPEACSIGLYLGHGAFDAINLLKKIRTVDQKVLCLIVDIMPEEKDLEVAKTLGIDGVYSNSLGNKEQLEEMLDLLATGQRKTDEN